MLYLIAILLIDAVALAYGIWEQFTQFRDQHFAEAEVIGHKAASSVNLTFKAVNAMSGMVNPIVRIAKPDGTALEVPLYTEISKFLFDKFPELNVGGNISVMYYGEKPKQAFLTDHPLAQKPLPVSNALVIGIILLLTLILFTVFFFCIT